MTNRSESREGDRPDPPAGKRTDAESGDEQRDAESGETDDSGHLAGVEDGAGCTEIWEHLSERREAEQEKPKRKETNREEADETTRSE